MFPRRNKLRKQLNKRRKKPSYLCKREKRADKVEAYKQVQQQLRNSNG